MAAVEHLKEKFGMIYATTIGVTLFVIAYCSFTSLVLIVLSFLIVNMFHKKSRVERLHEVN